jgi:hypothetical protein
MFAHALKETPTLQVFRHDPPGIVKRRVDEAVHAWAAVAEAWIPLLSALQANRHVIKIQLGFFGLAMAHVGIQLLRGIKDTLEDARIHYQVPGISQEERRQEIM